MGKTATRQAEIHAHSVVDVAPNAHAHSITSVVHPVKEMSADDMREALQMAVMDLSAPMMDMPDTDCCYIEEQYADYVILSCGMTYYKVPFTMDAMGEVTLPDKTTWQEVAQTWTNKHLKTRKAPVRLLSQNADTARVGGWLVVYGGEDLYGETFSKSTDFWLDKLGTSKPVLFDHGFDQKIKHATLGFGDIKATDDGLWFEMQLDKHNAYVGHVLALIAKGALGLSSGAVSHLVQIDGNQIKSWPIAEGSITPTPAEPRTLGLDVLRSLVAQSDALKDLLPKEPQGSERVTASQEAADPQLPTNETTKESDMTDIATLQEENAGIKAQLNQVIAALAKEPATKSAGYSMPAVIVHNKAMKDNPLGQVLEKVLRVKGFDPMTDPAYRAALVEAAGGNGGTYFVPQEYSDQIVMPKFNLSYLRRAGARIITMTGGEPFHVPILTGSAAAVLTAEGAAYTETEPTITEAQFVPYKYTRLSKASEELVADSRFDVWGLILAPDFVQSFAAAENIALTVGTGTNQPQGVVTAATVGYTTPASPTALAAADVIGLYYSLDYKYRDNAKWMMSDAALAAVRSLVSTTGQFLWAPGLDGNTAETLMGKPIIVNNSIAVPASNALVALFGDFSYYWIADWNSLSLQRLDELYAVNGYVGYRAFERFDGHLVLPAAVVSLKMHA